MMDTKDFDTESELIVCHDGGDLAPFFNHVYRLDGFHGERMDEALAALGLYAEQCTSWYTAIYRI